MLCASGSRISGARLRFSVSLRRSVIGFIWSFSLTSAVTRNKVSSRMHGGIRSSKQFKCIRYQYPKRTYWDAAEL